MRQKVKTNLFPKNKTKLFKIMLRQKKKKKSVEFTHRT